MTNWESKAMKIERLRERMVLGAIWAGVAVLVLLTVWTIVALIGVRSEEARLERETGFADYIHAHVCGGRS